MTESGIPPRNTDASVLRVVTAVCIVLLGASGALLMEFPDEFRFASAATTGQLILPLQDLSASATAATAELFGTEVVTSASTLWVTKADGSRASLSIEESGRPLRLIPPLTAAMILGGVMIIMTWRMGIVRKVFVVPLALLTPLSVVVGVGICQGVALAVLMKQPEPDFRVMWSAGYAGLALGAAILCGLWCLLKALVSDEDEPDQQTVAGSDLPKRCSPLVWALIGTLAITIFARFTGKLSLTVIPLWATMAMAIVAAARLRWAGRLAWIPALFTASPVVFMLAALVANDEVTATLGPRAMSLQVAERLRRRARRTAPTVGMVLLAIVALAQFSRALDPRLTPVQYLLSWIGYGQWWDFPPVLHTLCRGWVWTAPLAVGAALVVWSALQRRKRTGRLAKPLVIIAGVLVALSTVAALGSMWLESAPRLPMAWPRGVEVDEHFRLTSMPDTLGGRYRKISGEHGDRVFGERLLKALGIGTSRDKEAYPRRESAWYFDRIYEDTQGDAPRYWRLNVYYYTGIRDNVPHVPETARAAGGTEITDRQTVTLDFGDAAVPPEWRRLEVQRVSYLSGPPDQERPAGVEYYVFSFNGLPETDRLLVRMRLSDPTITHTYFAKIQFSPLGDIGDDVDTETARFLAAALPEILKALPSKADVDAAQ